MPEFYLTLSIANTIYLLLGIFYAWQIYLAPSPHGWTWISVAVGTLILLFGTMFNHFILYHYDMLNIATLLLTPTAMLALAGLPMTIGQAIKKYREDRDNKKLLGGDSGQSLDG